MMKPKTEPQCRGTSDGISGEDWASVRDIALRLANASQRNDATGVEENRRRMLVVLRRLEMKYGRLASILATQADYLRFPAHRAQRLSLAFKLAGKRNDRENMILIAHSLAVLHVETTRNYPEGRRWLLVLVKALGKRHGDHEYRDSLRLKSMLPQSMQW